MPAPATTNSAAPASSTAIAARVVDAVKVYGHGDAAVRALDGVSVDFPRGQFTAIMGPSGSGKSTLLHCMAALADASLILSVPTGFVAALLATGIAAGLLASVLPARRAARVDVLRAISTE